MSMKLKSAAVDWVLFIGHQIRTLLDSHVGLPTQSVSVWWPGSHFVSLRNCIGAWVSDFTVNVTLTLLQHVTWGRARFISLFLFSFHSFQRINRPILQGSLRSLQISVFWFVLSLGATITHICHLTCHDWLVPLKKTTPHMLKLLTFCWKGPKVEVCFFFDVISFSSLPIPYL